LALLLSLLRFGLALKTLELAHHGNRVGCSGAVCSY
jgi:hypothetical protein